MKKSLLEHLAGIVDLRRREGRRYSLPHILLFYIFAKLSCGGSYSKAALFIETHFDRLQELYPSGMKNPPSKAGLHRIIKGVDAASLEKVFRLYSAELSELRRQLLNLTGVEHRTVDGKAVRGSADKAEGTKAKMFLNVYSPDTGMVIAHVMIDEKTNEIPVAQALIPELGGKDVLYTADALHAQKKTFEIIEETGNTAIIQLKDNQPTLLADVESMSEKSKPIASCVETDPIARNQETTRWIDVFDVTGHLGNPDWQGHITRAIRVTRETWTRKTEARYQWDRSFDVAWYLTNRVGDTPEFLGGKIRYHWYTENRQHYVRDVTMGEDASRVRKNVAVEILIRSFVFNILRFNSTENMALGLYGNSISFDRMVSCAGI